MKILLNLNLLLIIVCTACSTNESDGQKEIITFPENFKTDTSVIRTSEKGINEVLREQIDSLNNYSKCKKLPQIITNPNFDIDSSWLSFHRPTEMRYTIFSNIDRIGLIDTILGTNSYHLDAVIDTALYDENFNASSTPSIVYSTKELLEQRRQELLEIHKYSK